MRQRTLVDRCAHGRQADVAGSRNTTARSRSKLLREAGFQRWTWAGTLGTMAKMPGGKDADGKDLAFAVRA